ncbi:response regulator [Sphingomonas astaxanthinifaciens]|uniref:histidine kinase n=1 Tax=Sphingomonas astaxanthinifaciens DSM 22298 TaxID=1123267 RepID=A0ABQ5Z8F7_9SPHN|nr:response regulator [Sphingomonas astaxanthinifaciens]GLR47079.1 two-component system sensor histidine kinase/response regulator [Sphingomonas astaxanthinifaciens DSM 22298]
MNENDQNISATRSSLGTIVGVIAALVFFVATGVITYLNIQSVRAETERVAATHEVITSLGDLLSAMQDGETGQRGFLLTANPAYLQPYRDAEARSQASLQTLDRLTHDDPEQRTNLESLRPLVAAKFESLAQSIAVRQRNGIEATLATIDPDREKAQMDAVRLKIAQLRTNERQTRLGRIEARDAAFSTAILSAVMAALLGMALTVAIGFLAHRSATARRRQLWLQAGEVGLAQAMLGDKDVPGLSQDIVDFLTNYVGAQASVLFKGEHGIFRRTAMLGVPAEAKVTERFKLREGLLGRVAESGKPMIVDEVPEGYLTIGSALGQDRPRHLVIAPLNADGLVNAVVELGFLKPVDAQVLELLDQVAGPAGTALRSAKYRTELRSLLEETQRQSEELQVQSEELKVSNEELEEQGRALKESAVRLEQQQVELEQTNSQLEEQARLLEVQRDDLAKSSAAVEAKARELEQASQYKSDFLANMSHELRTPLNSLLILSKLLGDNPTGNLTEEQAQYARTIQASGNDLLNLINDILDLSKIEAGHVEVQPAEVAIERLTRDLRRTFEPIAAERGVAFEIAVEAGAPDLIVSDRQRLEQILKNLLANAFKFTAEGKVTLAIARAEDDRIALSVSDTGIGIAPDQQKAIFEAFRQADGSINRKFGGTGLGLSISRELARLLGGTIALESEPGVGSRFTVTVPVEYDPGLVSARPLPAPAAAPVPAAAATKAPAKPRRKVARSAPVDDDRNQLGAGQRVLLIVEDDRTFAKIVRDIAREASFQTLIAGTAEEALDLAREHKPSGIVLDLGLPDQSGLAVLDRLKREDATRHIPIHVISASDQTQTAFSLGAMGYLVKPVKKEELSQALSALEAQLTRTMRRVLIVEDDLVQREAVSKLLAGPEIETVAVGTAAECLERLRAETFDCMVLDLSLPDASGYSLLETLSEDDQHSFPPVIVYTGHDLSQDEEQRLRRYSSSIIIKGAKSPERLLDEVTLFLHQVVSELPAEQQRMIRQARHRDAVLEGRRILVVEDDVRNIYSLTNILEPRGAKVAIARNGQEALDALAKAGAGGDPVDLVLMDVMMPVMDGLEATRRIRDDQQWARLPIIMLTAKAMPDDQAKCLAAGASDYMAKPLDVDKLLSLVRVWMPR